MKKNTLLLTALLSITLLTTHAQEVTVRLSGGYAGPGLLNTENVLGPKVEPATATVDNLVNMANINDSTKTNKPVHGSYGTGGNVTLAVGYMFNNYIGLELGVSYAHSSNISCSETRVVPGLFPAAYIYGNITSNSYALAILPSLIITGAKTGWKVYPYGRFGIVLPVAGKLTDNLTINSPLPLTNSPTFLGNHTDVQLVTEATLSLGFGGAVGVAYRPLPFMSIHAEINGQYMNVRGKSSTVTKWNMVGVSALPTAAHPEGTSATRSIYRTQFTYVDQLTPTSNNAQYNNNYDPKKPKEDLRPTVPGSNLGFNIGVTFYLSKKTLKKDGTKKEATKK